MRAGYLVGVRLTVVVPAQTLANGQRAAQGVENQALIMVEINGTRPALSRRGPGGPRESGQGLAGLQRARSKVAMRSRCAAAASP